MAGESDVDKLKAFFDFCDQDKSGFLSVQELEQSAGQFLSQEDMKQLIEILDPHGHGEISFSEFCQGVEAVLHSSEAKKDDEYGDELINEPVDAESPLFVMSNDMLGLNNSASDHLVLPTDKSPEQSKHRENRSNKRLSSNALAHQLFRSSSPLNGHSSRTGDYDSDAASSDHLSIDDDVQTLNDRIHQLQQQLAILSEGQFNNDNRYDKIKHENVALMTRIHSLEEQLREHEIKSEERITEEKHRLKEIMAKNEKEKNQELEEYLNRVHCLQQENITVKEEISRLKIQAEKIKQEKLQLQEQLDTNIAELSEVKNEKKKIEDLAFQEKQEYIQKQTSINKLLEQLSHELEELRQYQQDMECLQRFRSPSMQELPSRFVDLDKELKKIREENNNLREANEELQAQLLNSSVEKGCILLSQNSTTSLEEELESLSKEQLMNALRDQEEDNAKLRAYIDGMLLNIVENYPELLEVRPVL